MFVFRNGRNESLENQTAEEHADITDSRDRLGDNSSGEISLVEQWIQKNPNFRHSEVLFIKKSNFEHPCNITKNGDLQQPFKVLEWTFLLVLDKSFPRKTEQGELPIKVYLVNPGIDELQKLYNLDVKKIPCLQEDALGMTYLRIEKVTDDFKRYVNNQHSRCMSQTMILYTIEWADDLQRRIKQEKKQRRFGNPLRPNLSDPRYTHYHSEFQDRTKYVDGRASRSSHVNPRCQKVVLSNRALIQIFNESQSRIRTETGGLLLGHFDRGVWYVIEASDPGINAVFRVNYHEGDDVYQNHVCDVISRTYKHRLVFLGMWHRHPGSLDTFSGTDDGTNYKYAASAGNGCISAIINYDPDFRITFYYVEQGMNRNVRYTKVDIEVGDDKIPNKEMLMLADTNRVIARMK